MKFLIFLEDSLDFFGYFIVSFSYSIRIQNQRITLKRIHRRINPLFSDRPVQHDRRIKMRKGRRRSRIRKIICRNIHRLHRSNRPFIRGSNSLLQSSHLTRQGWLISYRRRDSSKQSGHLRSCLSKSEDIINKEQHIFSLFISKVFCHCQSCQSYSRSWTRSFVHLSINHRCFIEHPRFLHLVIKIVSFSGSFSNSSYYRYSAMLRSNIVNQLHHYDRFSYASPTKKSDFPSFQNWSKQINYLNPRF